MQTNIKDVVDFYKAFPEEIGNLEVLTRFGFKTIEFADVTAIDSEIIRIETDESNYIEGSPDHLILSNQKWVKLKDLDLGDVVHLKDSRETKISNISTLSFKEDLFDLQVADVKEFYANGIVSHNSTLLDALSYVLFGKPHRNINKPQLINSINGKDCVVECEFMVNKTKYKIIRGMKPNIFEIYKNGKLLNQESHTRDYQKILEQNIIKLNHKSFHQVVVLGSSNFVPFMKLPSHARREVIEDLLDIRVIGKMAQLHKVQVGVHVENARQVDAKLQQTEERIRMQKKHLEKLRDIRDQDKQVIEDDIRSEKDNLINLENKRDEALKRLSDMTLSTLNDKLKELNEEIRKHDAKEAGLKSTVDSYESTRKFMQEHTSCPTCEQEIDTSVREKKTAECTHKVVNTLAKIERIKSESTKLNDEKDLIDTLLAQANKIDIDIRIINEQINATKKRVKQLEDSRDKDRISSTDIEDAAKTLQSLQDKLALGMKAKEVLSNQRRYNAIITELLKDTGIKAKVIKQYLDPMNTLINKYLAVLDFFVLFNLNENFDETIRSRHRDEFSYASFSEGEKQRIDLALLFAWRHISKMKNSVNTNLLVLDEVFDSSLDTAGVDNLLKILGTLPAETRTFIISHKRDMLEGKFERRLEFEKHLNFSRLNTSS